MEDLDKVIKRFEMINNIGKNDSKAKLVGLENLMNSIECSIDNLEDFEIDIQFEEFENAKEHCLSFIKQPGFRESDWNETFKTYYEKESTLKKCEYDRNFGYNHSTGILYYAIKWDGYKNQINYYNTYKHNRYFELIVKLCSKYTYKVIHENIIQILLKMTIKSEIKMLNEVLQMMDLTKIIKNSGSKPIYSPINQKPIKKKDIFEFLIQDHIINSSYDELWEYVQTANFSSLEICKMSKFKFFIRHMKDLFASEWIEDVCESLNMTKQEIGKYNISNDKKKEADFIKSFPKLQ